MGWNHHYPVVSERIERHPHVAVRGPAHAEMSAAAHWEWSTRWGDALGGLHSKFSVPFGGGVYRRFWPLRPSPDDAPSTVTSVRRTALRERDGHETT
jgi:hypothetical protein